ncbi:MAG: HAD-IA family hydrolase [Pseudomonadales bacterium]
MSSEIPSALLLDLGNVVVDIDFRRVFASWSESAGVDVVRFYDRWQLDEAYKQHEIGATDFTTYCKHLSELFDVELSDDAWLTGWNALFLSPFPDVMACLTVICAQLPTYCFSNTNAAHHALWSGRYETALSVFERVFVSNEIGLRKPDVAAFEHVASEMAHPPGQILFIDDTLENVEGARTAGMQAAHVTSSAQVVRTLEDLVISRINRTGH